MYYYGIILYSGFVPTVASIILTLTASCPTANKYLHKCIRSIFFFDFFGRFAHLIHLVLFVESFLLWNEMYPVLTYEAPPKTDIGQALGQALKTCNYHLIEWRNQRNCYAVAWAYTAWWYVACIFSLSPIPFSPLFY